jgi:hypothetical protein
MHDRGCDVRPNNGHGTIERSPNNGRPICPNISHHSSQYFAPLNAIARIELHGRTRPRQIDVERDAAFGKVQKNQEDADE